MFRLTGSTTPSVALLPTQGDIRRPTWRGGQATDHLLGPVDRRDKETLTVRTAAGRAQTDSSGLESLRRTETVGGRQDLETTVEFVPRPRQQGLSLAGSLAPAFSGENGSVSHRR